MFKRKDWRRWVALGIVAVSCLSLVFACLGRAQEASSPRTLVTAAHLGAVAGYECVYVDEESDYAVHVCTDYSATSLKVGDVVSLAGTTATVTCAAEQVFYVDVDNLSMIIPGVSGSTVYYQSEPVGFISGWDGTGALRCVYY